ncbi:MAG: DUF2142 domain-containing protein [Actinomycetota bacterium]|nr:DUF2142 domain-containing protein [Actinomycetota bacterium]
MITPVRRRHRPLGLYLVAAFVLLVGVSWIVANPPGYTPDEPAHYTKAIGVGHRVWVGTPGAYDVGPGFGPAQLQWINQAARVVEIQPNMAPDGLACALFQPKMSAACLDDGPPPPDVVVPRLTYVGTYEPFMYFPAGVAMNRMNDPHTAMVVGRLVTGSIALALLVMAAAVLWVPGQPGSSLLGLLGATTPMVLFIASGLAPSGPEIGATICVTAVVLRLARRGPPTRLAWAALGAGGAVLGCSRSLGPYYLLVIVALFVVQLGPSRAWRALRGGGRLAALAVAATAAGVAANVAWGVAVQPNPPFDVGDAISSLGWAVRDVPEVLAQNVGRFGWADVDMPRPAYPLWGAMVAVMVGVAFAVGRPRQRLVLGLVIAGCLGGTVAIAVGVIYQTNFPMYGRYALPLWVIVPLVAGETIRDNVHRLSDATFRRLLVGSAGVVAAVHFTGFYANARRYAVGVDGPLFFLGRSEWSPPGGTTIWVVVVALGTLSVLLFGLVSAPRPAPSEGAGGALAPEQVEVRGVRLQPGGERDGADHVVARQGPAGHDVTSVHRHGEDPHPPR